MYWNMPNRNGKILSSVCLAPLTYDGNKGIFSNLSKFTITEAISYSENEKSVLTIPGGFAGKLE